MHTSNVFLNSIFFVFRIDTDPTSNSMNPPCIVNTSVVAHNRKNTLTSISADSSVAKRRMTTTTLFRGITSSTRGYSNWFFALVCPLVCSKVQFVVEVVVKVAKVMLLAMMMMRDFVFYRGKRDTSGHCTAPPLQVRTTK